MERKNLTQYVALRRGRRGLERRRIWESIAGARLVASPMDVGSRWRELTEFLDIVVVVPCPPRPASRWRST